MGRRLRHRNPRDRAFRAARAQLSRNAAAHGPDHDGGAALAAIPGPVRARGRSGALRHRAQALSAALALRDGDPGRRAAVRGAALYEGSFAACAPITAVLSRNGARCRSGGIRRKHFLRMHGMALFQACALFGRRWNFAGDDPGVRPPRRGYYEPPRSHYLMLGRLLFSRFGHGARAPAPRPPRRRPRQVARELLFKLVHQG